MVNAAIIFDVDGVLLDLTRAEEELFFEPFASRCDVSKLSRDWNSYLIRNDEDIVAELVERHGLHKSEQPVIIAEYLKLLEQQLSTRQIISQEIEGAAHLLKSSAEFAALGIATANLREAAKLRLEQTNLWHHVSAHAFGADGGGHKHEILGRALASFNLPKSRIIYIGDNVNDVIAGLTHRVHFIGFNQNPARLEQLRQAGAKTLSSNHLSTLKRIHTFLS